MKPIAKYWLDFALAWENSSYKKQSSGLSLIERVATLQREHIRQRKESALRLLRPAIERKNILEIGCGSGRFALDLAEAGADWVAGVDISADTIALAKENARSKNLEQKTYFTAALIEDLKQVPRSIDILVGLGILEYLDAETVRSLVQRIQPKGFLFSFDEKRRTLKTFLHYFYRLLKKLPYYKKFKEQEIIDLFRSAGFTSIQIARESGNSFVYCFPDTRGS